MKRKNRWGFTFYLMQTLCSPRPFLYSSTLKFRGFSAKLGEFHNCSGMLEESLVLPQNCFLRWRSVRYAYFLLIFSQDSRDTLEESEVSDRSQIIHCSFPSMCFEKTSIPRNSKKILKQSLMQSCRSFYWTYWRVELIHPPEDTECSLSGNWEHTARPFPTNL